MGSELLRPTRGGFLRPFGCAWFIREYLLGNSPCNSPAVIPKVGAPQADIFYHYKQALRQITAGDRATKVEEKRAKKEHRSISPDNIEKLAELYLARIPYKSRGGDTIPLSITSLPFRGSTGWNHPVR